MNNKKDGYIKAKEDGSFIIEKNGLPCHIIDGEGYEEEYRVIKEYAASHPEEIEKYKEVYAEQTAPEDMKIKDEIINLKEKAAELQQRITADFSDEETAAYKDELRKVLTRMDYLRALIANCD